MNSISTTQLYTQLAKRFGKEAAEDLNSYIEVKIDSGIDNKVAGVASKEDISDVKKEVGDVKTDLTREIAEVKTDLTREIAEVKTDLTREIAEVRTNLTKEIAEVKSEVIKWMFIFWIGQVAVTFGFILLFLKK
jgi:hypothetical protein